MTRLLDTRARDRGAVLPIMALLLPVLLVMTALAVDLGRQRADRRNMQAVADVVALDMSRLADGRTLFDIQQGVSATTPQPSAVVALAESAARNGVDVSQLTLTWGTFDAATETFTPLYAPADRPDAAHIVAVDSTDYYFQPGSGDVTRNAVAQLGRIQRAEIVVGSTLVGLDPAQGWFLGQLLSYVIPGAELVGYDGLADAEVDLADLAVALGAGSVDELLAMDVTFRNLVVATVESLSAQGNTVGVAVLEQLLTLDVEDVTVQVSDVLGLDTTEEAGLVGSVSVPQLLSVAAVLAGGSNFIRVPPTVVNLAGVGTLDLAVHVIEGPIRIGTLDGASGTTKQVGIDAVLGLDINGTAMQDVCKLPLSERNILAALISGLITGLGCVLGAVINRVVEARVTGTLELDFSVAGTTATQRLRCTTDQLGVDWVGSPLRVDTTAALDTVVTVAGTPISLLKVDVPPTAVSASGTSGTVTFDVLDEGPLHIVFEDVDTGLPSARVGAPTLGLGGLLQTNGLNVRILRADLPKVGALAKSLVEPTLNDILAGLDQLVVSRLSRLLGLNLGGADITPQWMDCDDDGSVALVQ